jgi:hypothetical protein
MSCSTNNSSVLPIGNTGATGQNGTNGTNGTDGENGTSLLYNNITDVSTTNGAAGAFESLQAYTLAANELTTNGDSLELISSLSVDVTTSVAGIRLYINGASVIPTPPASFLMQAGTKFCLFKATITRQSISTLFIQFDVQFSGGANYTNTGGQQMFVTGAAVNNLVTLTNTIAIFGAETASVNTLTAHNLMIKKYSI